MRQISFEEAKRLMQEENALLLDVREEEEYRAGHASGAKLFPLSEITDENAALKLPDQKRPLLIYCRTGNRSRDAAQLLESYGYEQLFDLGGLSGWPFGIDLGDEESDEA